MRKYIILLLTIFLVSPLSVFATEKPKVLTVEASLEGTRITYSGTTEDGVVAVMCKLYDEDTTEIDMLSLSVDNNSFEGTFTVSGTGDYTVSCANYDGGAIVNDDVAVEEVVATTYTVTFNTDGGSEIVAVTVDAGSTVNRPQDPTKDGFVFGGWYEDGTFTSQFDFSTPITSNTLLYAKWNNIQVTKHTVTFNTTGGSNIDSVEVEHDGVVPQPHDPNKDGFIFGGWYEDATCTVLFDFDTRISADLTLYAKWDEAPNDDTVPYEVPDGNGNSISFNEEEGHDYTFAMVDLSNLTDEEISELTGGEYTKEEYDAELDVLKETVSSEGTFVTVYEILVMDENTDTKEEGPFTIKIRKTKEMEKYNSFKLLYIDTDNEFEVKEVIELTEDEDGNLVGTLDHLSTYVLVGNNVESATNNPKTLDNIYVWVITLLISFIGLAVSLVSSKRFQKKKAK